MSYEINIMNLKLSALICFLSIIPVTGGVSPAAADEVPDPEPFPPVPSPAQLKWHKAEYMMFVHFGMKTFYPSSNHMGNGKEDPGKFNPKHYDANQWVEAAKEGGFKGIVLTTKHHDGFCNWPTGTTDHCVRSSTWKGGKGDIVGELVKACRKGGISFGFYVSIIDHNFNATGSEKYETYGEFYYDQLKELSTQYGPIDEYWFDGFRADKLKMDYRKIAELIKTAQPDAVVYDSGTLVKYLPDRSLRWPNNHGGVGPDQNYRVNQDDKLIWYPNEPSLILQGNWFYCGKPMHDLEKIKNYYLQSTGHGVTPLMNVSPNKDGLIDKDSVGKLKEFKKWVDEIHSGDLARGKKVAITADSVRGNHAKFAADKVADGDFETYHATDDGVTTTTIEVNLGEKKEVDGFILQEYIPLGQRVESYAIECMVNGKWVEVFTGKRIGYKRIILEGRVTAKKARFPATYKVRLKIRSSLACPLISTFQVAGKISGDGK